MALMCKSHWNRIINAFKLVWLDIIAIQLFKIKNIKVGDRLISVQLVNMQTYKENFEIRFLTQTDFTVFDGRIIYGQKYRCVISL